MIQSFFAAIYNSFARSSALYQFCYESKLHALAANILNENKENLGIRDPILRMDVPNDKRNTYGWHQIQPILNYILNSKKMK